MKKKLVLILLIIFPLVGTACGLNESGQLMSDARKFIESAEYDKAMDNLSKVLQEDESNVDARGMYYQALKLKKAERARNRKDYEEEITELQELINDNQGSAKVRGEADELLNKAQENFEKQRKSAITRKENAKKTAEENKSKYRSSSIYGRNQGYTQSRRSSTVDNSEDNNDSSSNSSQSNINRSSNTGTNSGVNSQGSGTGSGTGTGSGSGTGTGTVGSNTQSQ